MNLETSLPSEPTVVGIGASAGGLAALKSFFEHMPPDSGLAFVVIVHLSPDHESHLAELLQSSARFPVEQVTQTTKLERNHVYIIPPNSNIDAIDTHLRLSKLEENRQERAPIDHFFRTLADTHDWHAIAVVLTGTGSDGTLGARDIKAHGGVVIAQDPGEAEFDGMPQSVIASGVVDFVLPVAEIPASILRFHGIKPRLQNGEDQQAERALLQQVFAQLRLRTERDFSHYKRTTVFRRIARRMQLNYVEDLSRYVERLRERPEEARALADDLLINVTHFFRDPEVFARLERVEIPRLFEKQGSNDGIRVWSVGCATGEEAYSLAILLVEEAQRRQSATPIHIFASDLHLRSLEKARDGYYPGDIATDVAPERLKKFFQQENGGYRIRKDIRDLVVFAPHNLLADPPFSRLDFVSCRNLLIYLERDIQQDIIELFHYALNPDGTLLLGSAETADAADLFRVEDKHLCLYRKRNVAPKEPRLPVFPFARTRIKDTAMRQHSAAISSAAHGNLHQRLVEKYAPPSLLIGDDDKMLHLSENVGRFLVPPGGEPTHNAVRMVRAELRMELQACLHQARQTKKPLDSKPIPVRFNGQPAPVVLHLRPSLEPDENGFVLVIFEERETAATAEFLAAGGHERESVALRQLRDELTAAREQLQAVIDESESSKEEMKSSSEEMQSTNEELRSTMEELETSKEELQSMNEELQTVNQQNRHKVEELSQLSSDLQNLLAATDIATLFLDRDLRILRFTPKLSELFNIRTSDRGRPISDLTHRLGYADSTADARSVMARLIPIEREVQDDGGRWFLTRVLPYRSTNDQISGVVVTFVDITDRKDAEEIRLTLQKREQAAASEKALREKEGELARVSRTLMVGELATSIAHEMNQPLAGVVTNAEAALRWLRGGKPNFEEVEKSLALIVRDGNRAGSVIKRVRGFVKNEAPATAPLDLREVIRETLTLLQLDLDKKQIKVRTNFPKNLSFVRGDGVQLQQVVLNLVVNASEAMETIASGERELQIRTAETPDGKVEVAVQDNGAGMDPQHVGQVFDAFFSTKPTGIGMGLSISRSIIEAHGGQISLVRNADAGVTVLFRLPAGQGGAA